MIHRYWRISMQVGCDRGKKCLGLPGGDVTFLGGESCTAVYRELRTLGWGVHINKSKALCPACRKAGWRFRLKTGSFYRKVEVV